MKKKRKICSAVETKSASKRRRLDVAKKKFDERFFERHVVKCTLGAFSKYVVVTDEIRDCVYWMSRLMVHASHVMSLLVLENNGVIPIGNAPGAKCNGLDGLYNKIFRTLANFLQGVTRNGEDKDIARVCERYANSTGLGRGSWPEGVVSGWRGKVLEQMAKQSAVNHTTHIETNLFIYAIRYLKYLVRKEPEFEPMRKLTTCTYGKVISAITDAFWERTQVETVIRRRPSTLKVLSTDHVIWTTAQSLLDRMFAIVPEKTTLSRKSEVMFRIMKELEPFSQSLQEQFKTGVRVPGKRKWGKMKWTFSICPQMSWRPKNVHISSTAVEQLLKDMSKRHSHLKTVLLDLGTTVSTDVPEHERKYEIWRSLFKMKRVLRQKHLSDMTQLRFGNFISTDGVSVSAVLMKKKSHDRCELIRLSDNVKHVTKMHESVRRVAPPNGMAGSSLTSRHNLPSIRCWSVWISNTLRILTDRQNLLKKSLKNSSDKTIITERIKNLAGLVESDDGVVTTATKIVGLDPGKKSAATWVYHDPAKQAKHRKWRGGNGEKTSPEDRYESGTLHGGEWNFMSGQKQYTKKMNKRMSVLCPEVRKIPTTKTIDTDRLLDSYRCQVEAWSQIETAFFDRDTLWYQKQRMRRFCKEQRAMEDVVSRITGTRDKAEQKKVIVAYGDGDKQGNLRGTAPMMSTKLFKKVSQSACVVVVNEFRTSILCSCCRRQMVQFQKQFRMKRCTNSDCIRTVWDRDINASINILNLFLEACLSKNGKARAVEFSRRGCDE